LQKRRSKLREMNDGWVAVGRHLLRSRRTRRQYGGKMPGSLSQARGARSHENAPQSMGCGCSGCGGREVDFVVTGTERR
jgi:hypothetical protein